MQANRVDDFPSTSFLTLLICLQCSYNDFGGRDVSSDVSYAPEGKVDLVRIVFSKWLLGIPSAIKKLLEAINS